MKQKNSFFITVKWQIFIQEFVTILKDFILLLDTFEIHSISWENKLQQQIKQYTFQ